MSLGAARVAFTGRAEGDLGSLAERAPGGPSDACLERRRAVVDRPWTWLRQVHGARVVTVERPGGGAGEEADALVTSATGAALAVLVADCAPVLLATDDGRVVAAAHAGWRGLCAGVLDATVEAMRTVASPAVRRGRAAPEPRLLGALGPCIHAECYEFSPPDLDRAAAALGEEVLATTADGRPALDVPAAVVAALGRLGVEVDTTASSCTACDPEGRWYSHRARREVERQAGVVWVP